MARLKAVVMLWLCVATQSLEWKPQWSFQESARWLIARAPGKHAKALRDLSSYLRCDKVELSAASRNLTLHNFTVVLDDEESLFVKRVTVTCERPWDTYPLVVGLDVDDLEMSVVAKDLLLRDTNWHRLDGLEAALATLAPRTSSGAASGIARLTFGGVAKCELTPSPALGGEAATVVLTLDWEKDLEGLSAAVAALAEERGSVSPEQVFELFKAEIFRLARGALANALEARASGSGSSISLAGVDVDLLHPGESLGRLQQAAQARARGWFRERTGLNDGDVADLLADVVAALRTTAEAAAEDIAHAVEEIDDLAEEALEEIDEASKDLAAAVDREIEDGSP